MSQLPGSGFPQDNSENSTRQSDFHFHDFALAQDSTFSLFLLPPSPQLLSLIPVKPAEARRFDVTYKNTKPVYICGDCSDDEEFDRIVGKAEEIKKIKAGLKVFKQGNRGGKSIQEHVLLLHPEKASQYEAMAYEIGGKKYYKTPEGSPYSEAHFNDGSIERRS